MMSTEASEAVPHTPLAEIFAKGGGKSTEATDSAKSPTGDKDAKATTATPAVQATEVKAEPAKADAPKVEADTKDRTRDEKGRFKTEAEEQVAGAQAALVAERKKRQALERQLQERDAKPKKDFFEDPEGALNERDQKLRSEADERFFLMCEDAAKDSHKDYDAIVSAFLEDAEEDRTLAARTFPEMRKARNPAEFLYKSAKLHSEMKAVGGDLGKYRESVETPLKTELAARDAKIKELEAQLSQLGKVPSSLTTEQSSSRASVEADEANNPPPMDDILKPRKRRA